MTVAAKTRKAGAAVPEAAADIAGPTGATVARDLDGVVHILTCGSVDDGKSTLIGRLLWDASDLPDDVRATLWRSAGADGQPDLSLLVDGLAAEREQGITIDIAWRYFDTAHRRYVIIDSPGHEQYTRNMASGASHADVAIMLVDARDGVKKQTRRHAAILDLLGVRRVILAVNKMDLVDWSQARFEAIEADFRKVTQRFRFESAVAVPVAARLGDNVAVRSAHMPWHAGATLIDELDRTPGRGQSHRGPFRLAVQTVLRGGQDFRGLAGTISSGEVRVGDAVVDAASGRQARIKRIATFDGDLARAVTGQAVVIQLDRDLDIARGAILAAPDARPVLARGLDAQMVWLADTPLDTDRGLLLRTATDLVPVSAIVVRGRLNLESMTESAGTVCATNDIVVVDIELGRATALDRFADQRETGSFVLVDALTGATLAGGVVKAAEARANAALPQRFRLTAEMLARGVCADVAPDSREFRRRAAEVALILRAAGVAAEVEDAFETA
jgi:bifunctional enzyme CysN/CysC